MGYEPKPFYTFRVRPRHFWNVGIAAACCWLCVFIFFVSHTQTDHSGQQQPSLRARLGGSLSEGTASPLPPVSRVLLCGFPADPSPVENRPRLRDATMAASAAGAGASRGTSG